MQRKSTALVALVAVLGVTLLVVLWGSLGRRTDFTGDRGAPPERVSAAAAAPSPPSPAAALPEAARVAQAPDAPAPAAGSDEPHAPAPLRGRVTLDGTPIEGGWVRLRSAQGEWQSRAVIDYDGRFLALDVPDEALVLSFELRPGERPPERMLCLPALEVAPRAGRAEGLEIAWKSRQINVLVLDPERNGVAARLTLEGRGYDTSTDTGEDGRARLAVVDAGRFALRAETSAGLSGAVELGLDEDDELASVVVAVERDPPR